MTVIEHDPDGVRMSAEDCDKAGMPAAAQTLRDLANEVEASRPQLQGASKDRADALRGALLAISSGHPDPERAARLALEADHAAAGAQSGA